MARTRNNYLQIIFKFLAEKGPFKFDYSVENGEEKDCQCCGKKNIVNHYFVSNQKNEQFLIGSECQQWVLELTDAHLPAKRVRQLEPDQLVKLGEKYGITLTPTADKTELVQQVIDARRRFANTVGWQSRKARYNTANETAVGQTLLLTS